MYEQKQFSCFVIGEGTLPIQCAQILLERGHQILGVISPDAMISQWAKVKNILYIPQTDNLIAFLRQQPFDYLFSIVNNSVLPKEILELPRQYAINYHDALLPKYAGVNATSWALMHQEKTHGVTWHLMNNLVDSGDILKQCPIDIASQETAFTLNGKCYEAAISSFAELIDELSCGQAILRKQNMKERTFFPRSKRLTAGGVLSFNRCALDIDAQLRALDFGPYVNPLGLLKLTIGSDLILVPKLEVLDKLSQSPPGTVTAIKPSCITVSTVSYDVALHQVVTIDGETLSISDLVARKKLQIGYRFADIEPDVAKSIEKFDALIAKHEAFWVEKLANLQAIAIPYVQHPASHLLKNRYTRVKVCVPDEVTTFIKKCHPAWDRGDFLLAAFVAYLARLGGVGCFDIGLKDVKLPWDLVGLNGFFAVHVPCRVNVDFEQSFAEFFSAFKEQVELTRLHFTYARDVVARYPAFRSLLHLGHKQIFPVLVERVEKLDDYQAGIGNDLSLVISSDGKECCWVYNTEALNGDNIARMLDQFTTFLQGITSNPAQRLADIPLLSEIERHKILVEWNSTQVDNLSDVCIHQLFEAQVEQTPDAVAVMFEHEQLTYQELNARANQLGHYLQALGTGPEVLVGLCVERSVSMVVGLLAILKAGGVYLPLDPAYPQERLAFMLEDACVSILLTQENLVQKLTSHQAQLVCLDTDSEAIAQQSDLNLLKEVTSENLAYVIYTSGSMGKPKGVLISHGSIANHCRDAQKYFAIDASDRVLQFASLNFDASLEQIFLTLITGAKLVLRDTEVWTTSEFYKKLLEYKITVISLPPAYWQQLAQEWANAPEQFSNHQLKLVLVGGDEMLPEGLMLWQQTQTDSVRLFNAYGPTETTVTATFFEITPRLLSDKPLKKIPIGRPIPNKMLYILDTYGNPVPIGVPGELYIGGEGLARGYLNRPDVTAAAFIPNFFSQEAGARLYKTGDLGRYLPDGNIEYLSRIDNQVKIRGFRIELGEIEAVLGSHPDVLQTVVIAREDVNSDKRLVAYVVPNQKQAPTSDELRRSLKQKLPDYMMPAAFVLLDTLPLTPNGKVDRRALPAPDFFRQDPQETFVAPRDELELQLTHIWEKVLGIQPIGVLDNFFEVGGDSLLAVRLCAQIEKIFPVKLSLANLFQAPTVEQLASILYQERGSVPGSLIKMISSNGSKPPFFWCVQNLRELTQLAKHFNAEQPVYGLLTGFHEIENPACHIKDWATRYVDEIRAVQPSGPYFLGGFCLGGFLAFETAQQLQAQGEKVALLALVDRGGLDPTYRRYQSIVNRFQIHQRNMKQLDRSEQRAYIFKLVKRAKAWTVSKFIRRDSYEKFVLTYDSKVNDLRLAELAIQCYAPQQVYPDRLTLLHCRMSQIASLLFPRYGWGKFVTGELKLYLVPGDHISVLEEPHVQVLAEKLRSSLDSAQADD